MILNGPSKQYSKIKFSLDKLGDRGQVVVEYTMLVAVVAILCISVFKIIKENLDPDAPCGSNAQSINPKCIMESVMGKGQGNNFKRFRLIRSK